MIRNFFGASLLALTLAACGGGDSDEKPVTDETVSDGPVVIDVDEPDLFEGEPEPLAGIEITRLLGTFDGDVTGLAFARNTTTPQNSVLLAANGTAGIAIIPTSESETPGTYDAGGRNVTAIAVGAMDENTLIAFESTDTDIHRLDIAAFNENWDDLIVIASLDVNPPSAKELCFAGASVFRINRDDAMTRHEIILNDGALVIEQDDASFPLATDCSTSEGTIELRESDSARSVLNADGVKTSENRADAPEGSFGMVVMPTQEGAVSFFANAEGEVLVNDTSFSFLIEGEPISIRHLAAAPGNFGGVNRNGVMAVLTTDNQLGLVSWLSIANHLNLPKETAEKSDDLPEEEDSSFTPQIELPTLPPVDGQ